MLLRRILENRGSCSLLTKHQPNGLQEDVSIARKGVETFVGLSFCVFEGV